jgi:hypothetical protein
MAVVDAWLVFSDRLQAPNAILIAASAGIGHDSSASWGTTGLGYGDFFAAAVVGSILAVEGGPRVGGAAAMLLITLAWDQLFLVYDVIPATIPPALVLIGAEVWRRSASPRPARGLTSAGSLRSGP